MNIAESIAARLEFYENQVKMASKVPMGRPNTLVANLDAAATAVSRDLQMAGVTPTEFKIPKPKISRDAAAKKDHAGDPRPQQGRIDPEKNTAFYAGHRKIIASLKKDLAKLG
jgi:hypothetical protein